MRRRPTGTADRALLLIGYDPGLRASELVAIKVEHIVGASDFDVRRLSMIRKGRGRCQFSPWRVRAIATWLKVTEVEIGSVFRRGERGATRQRWRWAVERQHRSVRKHGIFARRFGGAVRRVEYDVGEGALHPTSSRPIYRVMVQGIGDGDGAVQPLHHRARCHRLRTHARRYRERSGTCLFQPGGCAQREHLRCIW
jgi:integrase